MSEDAVGDRLSDWRVGGMKVLECLLCADVNKADCDVLPWPLLISIVHIVSKQLLNSWVRSFYERSPKLEVTSECFKKHCE